MERRVRLRELLVGIEGLALLRHLYEGADGDAERRLAETRSLLEDDAFSAVEPTREVDARTGYRSWAETYDEAENPIIALEQPVVWSVLESRPLGRALDAACGTGRHARRLVDLGHSVVGVDVTPAMLARATSAVPEASFIEADLRHIPVEDEQFEIVVCGLALAHLPDLGVGVTELSRVLKPAGRMVVSALHPFLALLGWQAPFSDAAGQRGFIREHPHTHADYVSAFAAAGLEVLACFEPALSPDLVRTKRRAFGHIPEATLRAYVGLPGVLVWHVEKPAPRD